jgi:oligoendopeptidase F
MNSITSNGMKKTKTKKPAHTTTWDLSVMYASGSDPAIERDVTKFEKDVEQFVRTYSQTTKQFAVPVSLKRALTDYEKLTSSPNAARAGYYFGLRRELDAQDDEAEKRLNVLGERLTKAGTKLLFFELSLGRLSAGVQKRLLDDSSLSKWHYYLHGIFEEAKHHLSEQEERIMSLKGNTSHGLWVAGTEKILNRRTVTWKGTSLPLPEALELVPKLPKGERRKLWSLAMKECRTMGELAENEFTAIVLDKKTNDELRKFPKPYSATALGYENTDASVQALVTAVKNNYDISHRFYRLKARMMKEKRLHYADRSARVGAEQKIGFDAATATLRTVFYDVNPDYATILDRLLMNGQIDVFPKKGKSGGAFCASLEHLPTYVMLNYMGEGRSLMTYAHEMGHAIHAERSKVQPPIYQGHSTAVAETASTLFENLVFDAHLASLSRKERSAALHDKIQDDIAGIQRQIAFFEFEREMHETIRANGAMNHTELASLMQKHLQAYLGPAVEVTMDDAYTFVYVSHFRRFFYVYTYAYGNLVSGAIAERFKSDRSYAREIDRFLTAGCSMSPDDIFKTMGIDVTKPSFFEAGLTKLRDRIDELENLVDGR